MPQPERLRFHQTAMDLLGQVPAVSDASLALLGRQERRYGITFPAAVREWYGLEGAVALLFRYSNQDRAVPLDQLGEELEEARPGAGERWAAHPVVVVQHENQSVCRWGVLLDGSEDPPVLVDVTAVDDVDEAGRTWRLYCGHFSIFVYTHAWDWTAPCWDESACHLEAQDQPLTSTDLAYLQRQFVEAPRTYGWPATTTYRFAGDDVRLLIWDREGAAGDAEPSRPQHAYWMLWAADSSTMTGLVEWVRGCGTLPRELFGLDDCGEAVIRQLFPGRPDPRDTRPPQDIDEIPF